MLLDTNINLRLVQPQHPMHTTARVAVDVLLAQGEMLQVLPQNIAEFWHVATRPLSQNGLGFSFAEVSEQVNRIEETFTLIPDVPEIYAEWLALVRQYQLIGIAVFDARLVAAMRVHKISSILTFNTADFRRYRNIRVIHPSGIS